MNVPPVNDLDLIYEAVLANNKLLEELSARVSPLERLLEDQKSVE